METKYMEPKQRLEIIKKIREGDVQQVFKLIDEMDRLKMVICDYEIVLKMCSRKLEDTHGKEPKSLE